MESLRETTYRSHIEVLRAAQSKAKECGFAVATKNSNKKAIYIQCVHGQEYKDTHGINDETRKLRRVSIKKGCSWTLYASMSKKTGQWTIKSVSPVSNHNHDMDIDAAISYHQHRVMSGEVSSKIAIQSMNGISPAKIYEEVRPDDGKHTLVLEDIYRFRSRFFGPQENGRVMQLLDFLHSRQYQVRYVADETTKKLKALFIAHPLSIDKARRFREVVVIDTTYKTNIHRMPMVNFVGVGNWGTSRLRSFYIGCAFVTDEREMSYDWVATQMSSVLWDKAPPGLFVTDDEQALTAALNKHFPNTPTILCCWHVEKNFEKHAAGIFERESKEREMFISSVWKLLYARTENDFTKAIEMYHESLTNAKKDADVLRKYLDR